MQLRAPQDSWVYGNRFIRVPLRIVPGAPHGVPVQVRPTKFTSVEKNEFTDAIIETTQRVTAQYGAGDDDQTLTAAHDLEFYKSTDGRLWRKHYDAAGHDDITLECAPTGIATNCSVVGFSHTTAQMPPQFIRVGGCRGNRQPDARHGHWPGSRLRIRRDGDR